MSNLNVIIADDHPIVLFGIKKSLEQIEWINVVGEFEDSTALINNLPKLDANVLITDLSMPGDKYGDGITLIKYIKRHFPHLSIIVLTMNNNPAILSAVLELDIEGIVLKQGAPTDLPKALAALQKGKKIHAGKRQQGAGKKSAPAAMAINACRRKKVKCCVCLPKASW
ncbi:hypothetical protein OS12_48800 [Dickeya oryzae]